MIPVLLVTGFLGSGKTTLLRRLAETHRDWRMMFLVNEFADTNTDALTLETTGTPTQSVVGGSLFCECKAGEFVRVMHEQVLARHAEQSLDTLVIETSGIADPEAIGELMSLHGLSEHFEIRRIVCVVAAKRFLGLLANLPAAAAQIRSSDLVILNKIDLVDAETVDSVEAAIRRKNPDTEIHRAQHCAIHIELGTAIRSLPRQPLSTCEANPFSTATVVWPADHPLETAQAWLESLPPSILRVKGTLATPAGQWQVERTVDTLELEPAPARDAPKLVLIAHDDNEEDLQAAQESLTYLLSVSTEDECLFKSNAILACDVFSEELTELAGSPPLWHAIDYLEMGLHDHPPQLRKAVQESIAKLEANPEVTTVLLAYGRCGNGLVGVRAGRCPLILPQAHDCISILLGSRAAHDAVLKTNPGTYFYSPGWVRGKRVPGPDREAYLRELYAQRFDDEMIDELVEADQEAFAHHNCAAFVSIVDRPDAERYCKDCARHLGWSQKTLPGDPSFLRDLLKGDWTSDRFLRVEPGQTIDADSNGNLTAIE